MESISALFEVMKFPLRPVRGEDVPERERRCLRARGIFAVEAKLRYRFVRVTDKYVFCNTSWCVVGPLGQGSKVPDWQSDALNG